MGNEQSKLESKEDRRDEAHRGRKNFKKKGKKEKRRKKEEGERREETEGERREESEGERKEGQNVCLPFIDLSSAPKNIFLSIGSHLLENPKDLMFDFSRKSVSIHFFAHFFFCRSFLSCNKKLNSFVPLFWRNLVEHHFPESWKGGMGEEESKREFLENFCATPKWFVLLCSKLETHQPFLEAEGVFRIASNFKEVKKKMKKLEKRKNAAEEVSELLETQDVHLLAGLIKIEVRRDEELKIDLDLKETHDRREEHLLTSLQRKISNFPAGKKTKLKVLVNLLAKVVEHSNVNLITLSHISIIFAPQLFSTNDIDPISFLSHSHQQSTRATSILIEHRDQIF